MKELQCTKIETNNPSPRYFHSCCSINDKMYIFGGVSKSSYLNELWVYDPSSNTWEEKNPSNRPSKRYGHTAQVINNKMYIFGGYGGVYFDGYLNNVWVYDPENNTWEEKTSSTPIGKLGHSACAINNKMYIFGGYGYDDMYSLNVLWEYDPENNTWEEKNPSTKPKPRYQHSCCSINDKMYIFGGYGGGYFDGYLNNVWVYDPEKNTWEEKTSNNPNNPNKPNKPSSRFLHSCCSINDKMYVFGGSDINFLNDLWEYDPEKNTWEQLLSPLSPRYSHTAQVINDKMYVFGGNNGNDGSSSLNELWELK